MPAPPELVPFPQSCSCTLCFSSYLAPLCSPLLLVLRTRKHSIWVGGTPSRQSKPSMYVSPIFNQVSEYLTRSQLVIEILSNAIYLHKLNHQDGSVVPTRKLVTKKYYALIANKVWHRLPRVSTSVVVLIFAIWLRCPVTSQKSTETPFHQLSDCLTMRIGSRGRVLFKKFIFNMEQAATKTTWDTRGFNYWYQVPPSGSVSK